MINVNDFDDVNILARTAYGENRGGGVEGMQSVLNVIMNRAAHAGWFGSTPREVCLKPLQFDCWMPSDPNFHLITTINDSLPVFASAMALAQSALDGMLEDITNGATYYFADTMLQWPHWAQGHSPSAVVAHQLFFNDIA